MSVLLLVVLSLQYMYLILDQWHILGYHMYEHFIILIASDSYYLITDLHSPPLLINCNLFLDTHSLNETSSCQVDIAD